MTMRENKAACSSRFPPKVTVSVSSSSAARLSRSSDCGPTPTTPNVTDTPRLRSMLSASNAMSTPLWEISRPAKRRSYPATVGTLCIFSISTPGAIVITISGRTPFRIRRSWVSGESAMISRGSMVESRSKAAATMPSGPRYSRQ